MTDEAFAKLGGLIEAGYVNFPGKPFQVEIPGAAWEDMVAARKSADPDGIVAGDITHNRDNFIYQRIRVVRGAKWMVHEVEK